MQRTIPLPWTTTFPAWERTRAALAETRQRLADPTTRPALLWHIFWAPFWIWSDAPVPELPRRSTPVPLGLGLAGEAVVSGLDRVRRRLWVSHGAAAICRGLWLAIAFAALLMLLDVLGGPVFDPRPAIAAGVVTLGAGLVLAVLSKPSRVRTARMLDRTFGLHERMGTALDDLGLGVPGDGERAPVVYLQMADAANAIAALRNDRRLRPALPVREVVLVVLCALLLTTLAFLRGLGGGLPELAPASVPVFTPAIERPVDPEPSAAELEAAAMPPTVQEVLERSDRSSRARRDLQALAEALDDHALTRPAAEQIARGDYASASEQLRDASSRAGDLSQDSREGLAGDLDQAAGAMDPETNGLEEATRDAASGLRQGDESARTEMRDLADAVEQTGEDVVPQGDLASQMRSAQQSQSQSGDSGTQPAETSSGDPGSTSSSASASGDPGSGVDAEASTSSQTQSGQSGNAAAPNGETAGGTEGQGSPGEGSRGNAPGDAEQPGAGENGTPGEGARTRQEAGNAEGAGDSATAMQGAGAGTGEGVESAEERAGPTAADQSAGMGEEAADPNTSAEGAAEADPTALDGASDQVALPSGSGDQGVQTSSDGGSALRGSGAGITAGSGFAVQGEVGQAGPDSNRVPAEHRETVERYFSTGGGE
jgi:hypothetical protein